MNLKIELVTMLYGRLKITLVGYEKYLTLQQITFSHTTQSDLGKLTLPVTK